MDEVADDRPIDQRHLQLGRPVQEDVAQTWGFLHRSILNPPIPGSSGKNTKIIRFNQTTNKVEGGGKKFNWEIKQMRNYNERNLPKVEFKIVTGQILV